MYEIQSPDDQDFNLSPHEYLECKNEHLSGLFGFPHCVLCHRVKDDQIHKTAAAA